MASVEERYNNILKNAQVRYDNMQSVNQRYNSIMNKVSNNKSYIERQKQLQEQQRLEEERKRQEQEEHKKKSQQLKQQSAKINAIGKNNNNQGINSSKLKSSNSSKFNTTTKAKAYIATNLAKDLNISVEDAQKRIDAQRQEEEKDVLAKWSKNIRNSAIGNSPGGKTVAEAIDTYNALGDGDLLNIIQNVESGITTGFANATSYLSNVGRKKNEILDNMGVGGKILAGLTGDFGYVFSNKESRQKDYDTINNWATNLKKQENEKVQKNIESTNSKVTKKVAELSPSMGNNLVGAGISYVNPIAGTAYFTTSAGGSYYDDAINRGMNEDQALLYGTAMGTMEGVTEQIPVSKMLGAGKNIGKESLKVTLKQYGISMAENAVQEAVIEPISELSALAIGGKETADFSNMGSRILKSGIDGALSSILLNGVNAGVSSAVKLQGDIKSGKQVTQEQIKKVMQDIQESGKVNVEAIIKQEMQYQTQKAKGTVLNIEQNPTQTPNNVQNLQQNAVKNQSNVQQQQISQVENKNVLNQNVEGQTETKFSKILNNKKLPMQSYIYEKSDNIKIDNLRKQANKIFNNSQEAHNYVGMLEKIITDKNVEIVFDANLKDENGNLANGKYENGVITINPNSNRVGEFIAIHELTHAIGTKTLRKIVDEYRKSNSEFDKAVQKLLSNYNQTEITDEALSDVCAQLFGNQEYINNLAIKNPNLFQKIYSEIKYLWHQFNGYKNKEQFVEDLMFKWEQVYRKNAKLNNKTGYSFAGENAKIANFKNLDFAKQMEQQGKTAQEIFEQTGWYKGNEGKWRFELDDSSWNINDIKKLNTDGGLFVLEDILDAPELYEAYPDIKNLPVIFDKTMNETTNGALETDYYGEQTIRLNPNNVRNTDAKSYEMLGLKNQSEIFSTLQHEIQHYIQRKEGMSTGASPKYWNNVKNEEFQNNFINIFGTQTELAKKYGLNKSIDIRYNLGKYLREKIRILNLQESILESKSKINTENNDIYQENINRANRFIKETNQWVEETKKDLESLVGKNGLKKVEIAYNKYLDFLNNRAEISYNLYRNTAGEQEARNVQDRIKLSSGEKKNTLPFIKDENTVYAKDSNESFSQKQTVENKVNKVYNRITAKERNQIIGEVMTWKNNQEDGIYYIDLSKNGYYSYIYEKNGDSVIPIRKIIGSEEFLNAVRKGVENGTYQESETINEWLTTVKNESKNNRSSNVGLPKGRTYNRNARLYSNDLRTEKTSDRTGINEKNIRDGGLDDSSSFNLPKTDNQGKILTKEQQEYFKDSKVRDENGNLLEVYHGTDSDFNEFNIDYLGSSSGDLGFLGDGFYLATHKGEAGYYGQKVMSGYVNITNPFNIQELSYYNGQYMNGEDSNPFLKIKNLVDMNSEWSNIEINSTTYGKIADTVSSFLKDIKVEKAGDIVDSRNEVTGVMWNITVNGKTYQVESVPYYNKESMIADELNKNMRKKFGYLNSSEILQYITEEKRFNNGKSFSDVLKEKGYDGIVQGSPQTTDEIVIFNSNQFKNIDNTNPTTNPDIRYSKDNSTWQQYLEKEFPAKGTTTNFQDIKLPTKENTSTQKTSNMQEQQNINLPPQKNKTLNPTEIANLKQEDANTTVKLPQKESKQGNRVSNFFGNVTQDAQFLNEDLRKQISQDDGVIYYQGVTNEQTLNQAFKELQDGGSKATLEWFNQDSKKATAKDTAKGWILLKQYQDAGDYQSAVEVAKKMREIGTNAGQTVQAFNILSRLTPEGMVYYAQSELSEAYEAMVKNKSKDWIDKNASSFDLTPQETQFIMDTMEEVGKMEDGYDKKVKLAEIQKIITDKIPPTKGQSIKAWMRISMLFNPKTQVRNIAGNATILPVNMFSDLMSTAMDKAISKKTGVRTTGMTNIAKYGKGFGKGLYESYNDFRKGINTRNIQGNRFEVKEGRSFKNKGLGKALNKVDNMLSFMLDAGDRGFYEATFTNSINNQLVLNKTTEVTQDMIDIATNEALQRTWQDNNEYTKAVLQIRKILNKFGTKSYGLGDVLIPFAKTPANLTKAIIDYSPVGLAKTITRDAMIFNRSLSNGQYSPQLQHKFVQNLGKGMAGTALYVLGYALAKAGIASGEPDDDKDVKNFMKNSLGISSYSIKIGDKSFTFDWAQPVATPLAIMTNYVKYSEDNPDAKAIEKALQSINIGTEQLLQQSFMESLNTVLNGNGTFVENLSQAVLDLPARAIPTFSKQIADMVDGTQRTTFEYNQPLKSAVNSVKAKIPGLSKTLPPSIDTLGNEIQKYGGENNLFNVFFNPANVNKGELSKAGEEIYELYKETGNTAIFPRTAPYYMNSDGEKINMTAETRAEFQEVSGKYVEKSIEKLLKNKEYKKLSNSKKAELIEEIVSDSYNQAKYEVLDIESKTFTKTRQLTEKVGVADYYDFVMKTTDIEGTGAEKKKIQVLANANYSNEHKEAIYEIKMGSDDELYNTVMKNTGINMTEYLNYKSQTFSADKKDDGTVDGKSISGSKKKKVYAYVNNMKITGNQRLLLLGTQYKLTNSERQALAQYVKSLNITNKEKLAIYDKLQGFTVYKDGRVTF